MDKQGLTLFLYAKSIKYVFRLISLINFLHQNAPKIAFVIHLCGCESKHAITSKKKLTNRMTIDLFGYKLEVLLKVSLLKIYKFFFTKKALKNTYSLCIQTDSINTNTCGQSMAQRPHN